MQVKKILKLFYILVILLISNDLSSQNLHRKLYQSVIKNDTASNMLDIRSVSFLKNVEAFTVFLKGYTMPGTRLELSYNVEIAKKLKLRFGGNWIYYFGDVDSTILRPLFRLDWRTGDNTHVLLGSLPEKIKLAVPDFLLHHEFFIKNPSTGGIAIVSDWGNIQGYSWFESERYIHKGSLHPEYLFGASLWNWRFNKRTNSYNDLLLAFTVGHQGGQINDTDKPVVTTANLSAQFTHNQNVNEYNSIAASVGGSLAYKATPYYKLLFRYGWAAYADLEAKFRKTHVDLMYFFGNRWFSYKGNPMYSNVSMIRGEGFGRVHRSCLSLSAMRYFNISDNVKAGLGGYAFYEFYEKNMIHGVSFHIAFDLNYKVKLPFRFR